MHKLVAPPGDTVHLLEGSDLLLWGSNARLGKCSIFDGAGAIGNGLLQLCCVGYEAQLSCGCYRDTHLII